MKTPRKSRDDVEAIGKFEPYIPRNKFEYDEIDGALKPLDKLASSMEAKWGIGKLQTIVSPETSSKFQSAKAKLDEAIAYNNPKDVVKRAGIMMRGWEAIEKEAISLGYKPYPADVWMANAPEEHGRPAVEYTIIMDSADASKIKNGTPVYNLTEVARMIRFFNSHTFDTDKVKALFPDAEVKNIRLVDDTEPPF